MDFLLKGHNNVHAVQTVLQVFFQNESYRQLTGEPPLAGSYVLSEIDGSLCRARLMQDGGIVKEDSLRLNDNFNVNSHKKEATQAIGKTIFNCLSDFTGYKPPWGAITGVRPAKIVQDLYLTGKTPAEAANYLAESYLASADKIALCLTVAEAESKMLEKMGGRKGIGVYIGIPFCPTRCHYCSFTSYPIKQHEKFLDGYFKALYKEIAFLGRALKGKPLEALYIGGGTPTSITAERLDELLSLTVGNFGNNMEFTVEAGRPDSITYDKLKILKKHGVSRISINPQTMKEETLAEIGRNHSVKEFTDAYKMACDVGFDNINCDLILGLPGESPADVTATFQKIKERIGIPKSLTVHTLAIKRAAQLNKTQGRFASAQDKARETDRVKEVEEMIGISYRECESMGLKPYYMYRQKNMVGNFENVGYALPGYECKYNVQTMTERQSVYAAGAGAVTKIINHEEKSIKRAFNVKDLKEYIERTDEMIERKNTL